MPVPAVTDAARDVGRGGDLGVDTPREFGSATVTQAGRLVITRLQRLTERIDQLHGDEVDAAIRDRLHAAQQQLQATVKVLTGLPEAIDPSYRR